MGKATRLLVSAAILWVAACSQDGSVTLEESEEMGPAVQDESTYAVLIDRDLVYADGLGYHPTTQDLSVLPLLLDVYYPDNDAVSKPLLMWIHGGGFTQGSKTADDIEELAEFYASRGWVVASINYRTTQVLGDGFERPDVVEYYHGIAPAEWTVFVDAGATESLPFHQSIAMYTAQRDSKAALRWMVANSSTYRIDLDYITVGGNSAGAITATTLGMTEQEDFRDELSMADDPTLSTAHVDENYAVRSLIWYWGSTAKLELFESVYGLDRIDSNDPDLFMAHGDQETEDNSPTPHTEAIAMKAVCDSLGIYSELHLLEGWHHGAWDAEVDGKTLSELSFDFVVETQNLQVDSR